MMNEQTTRKAFLLIFSGIPSCGKSTIASRLAQNIQAKTGGPVIKIASDDFREMITFDGTKFSPYCETLVKELTHAAITIALGSGYIVICDDLNYFVSMRKDLSLIAKKSGAGFGVVHVEVPLEKATEWNARRGTPIPDTLIIDVWNKFETPGRKYNWDKPIATINPSERPIEEIAENLLSKVLEAMKVWGKPLRPSLNSNLAGRIDSATRREMGEIVKRLNRSDLAPQLSILRRQIVNYALASRLSLEESEKFFATKAAELITRNPAAEAKGKAIVHVGILGHVDHGKTSIARCLTEHASTASLDKHPEAQRRGMTIDLGFSSFVLDDSFLVNLVDMPGHQDLIRQVVSGASIIDAAILVIDAKDGEGVQTTEHLAIVRDLNVERLLVVLNKKDLVSPEELARLEGAVRGILQKSDFRAWEVTSTSALLNEGIQELKLKLRKVLATPPVRNWSGSFKMPIDHYFPISGMGTIVTGTILRGGVSINDEVVVAPLKKRCRIRMIQSFGENRGKASAGDRVGIALSGIRASDLKRGFVLCSSDSIRASKFLVAYLTVDRNFRHVLRCFDLLHVHAGLLSTQAQLISFSHEQREGKNVVDDKNLLPDIKTLVFLRLNDGVITERGDRILLYKLDVPPKMPRVVGSAVVVEVLDQPPQFYKKKLKKGKLGSRIGDNEWVVTGLFERSEGAKLFVGKQLYSNGAVVGRIVRVDENDGSVVSTLENSNPVLANSPVELPIYRRLEI